MTATFNPYAQVARPARRSPAGRTDSITAPVAEPASTVQLPTGIPVATVAVDGAANAALLAVAILALGNPEFSTRLAQYCRDLAEETLKG